MDASKERDMVEDLIGIEAQAEYLAAATDRLRELHVKKCLGLGSSQTEIDDATKQMQSAFSFLTLLMESVLTIETHRRDLALERQ